MTYTPDKFAAYLNRRGAITTMHPAPGGGTIVIASHETALAAGFFDRDGRFMRPAARLVASYRPASLKGVVDALNLPPED